MDQENSNLVRTMVTIFIIIVVVIVAILLIQEVNRTNNENDNQNNQQETEQNTNQEETNNEDARDINRVPLRYASENGAVLTLSQPTSLDSLTCPIDIFGTVEGNGWFNEGQFTVALIDSDGNQVSETNAEATGDWTTNEPVTFTASLTCNNNNLADSILEFRSSNPSGLAENQDTIIVNLP